MKDNRMNTSIDLAFVIPFVSEYSAKDYTRSVHYLDLTLQALRRQNSVRAMTYLVSNDLPSCDMSGVCFVKSDIHIINPDRPGSYQVDKERKLTLGIGAAAEVHPTYIMCVDGDDILFPSTGRRILSSGTDIVSLQTGWIYNQESRAAYISPRFFKICGTSLAFRSSAATLPTAQFDFEGWRHNKLIEAYWTVSGHKQDPKAIAARHRLSYSSIKLPVGVYRVWPSSLSAPGRKLWSMTAISQGVARVSGRFLERKMAHLVG